MFRFALGSFSLCSLALSSSLCLYVSFFFLIFLSLSFSRLHLSSSTATTTTRKQLLMRLLARSFPTFFKIIFSSVLFLHKSLFVCLFFALCVCVFLPSDSDRLNVCLFQSDRLCVRLPFWTFCLNACLFCYFFWERTFTIIESCSVIINRERESEREQFKHATPTSSLPQTTK